MKRNLWFTATLLILAVSAYGQDRTLWRTAADVREGIRGTIVGTVVDTSESQRQLTLTAEDDRYSRITVVTDSVSTQYNGFGTVINDSPEIFKGSRGFANIRLNDRIEVRGTGRAAGSVMADQITLLGRAVAAPQTGVGETRPGTSVSTPSQTPSATADVFGRVEGVIRQINLNDNRLVVETDRREIFNIRTSSTTPVYYRGDVYQVRNLEIGDRIRVESDDSTLGGREIRARAIDVVRSVDEGGTTTPDRRVTSISGTVTRVDRPSNTIRLDTGRDEVRVDLSRAGDAAGRSVRASDVVIGDRLEISGSYSNSDLFLATTVRFGSASTTPLPPTDDDEEDDQELGDFVTVTLSGTVVESLADSATLGVRDRATGRTLQVFVADDFVIRTKTGGYSTADKLNVNDAVMIKAYRDEDNNYIAQTIRIR